MQIETIQAEDLAQLDRLVNEAIERRKVIDIKLTATPFQDKILYTALTILDD